ncbi:MAG TPA: PGPGW domain-containing protein [Steroidobacteraceae bacterium]|nr:PGPGW domain-containing protein [Steroidobacteraceae bacterium]
MFDDKNPLVSTYKLAKRIVIGVVGGTVLVIGIAMIVLPGPAFVVIPVGLGILSLEFAWARNWLRKVKTKARSVIDGFSAKNPPPAP